LVVALSLACGGGKGEDEDSGGLTDAIPTGGTETDELAQHPDGPVLTGCEAVCEFHSTGDQFYIWSMGCDVTDPQGEATIQAFGELLVLQGTLEVASSVLACGDGRCSGGFKEDALDVVIFCDDPTQWNFTFVALDLEGHTGIGSATGQAG
jgi:hypothetical protein